MKIQKKQLNAAFLVDGYKLLHHVMYPDNTTLVFSNMTPRGNKFATIKGTNSVVIATVQYVIKDILYRFDVDFFRTEERKNATAEEVQRLKSEVINEIKEEFSLYTNADFNTKHFEELWDLGYLPVVIRTLDEGTACPMKVPYLTIHNTDPKFFWVTNYLETIISNMLWIGITTATTIRGMRSLVDEWAIKTVGNADGTDYQLHDFSMRGLKGVDNTILSGIGFLTSSLGTDNIPAIPMVRWAYGDKGPIAGGVPASEHSIMTSEGALGEFDLVKRLIELFPEGFLSLVADSFDYWKFISEYLPKLKELILNRNGRLVVRPDSGNVINVICGSVSEYYEEMSIEEFKVEISDTYWDHFNYEINNDGYASTANEVFKMGDKYYHVIIEPEMTKTRDHNGNSFESLDYVNITKFEEVEPTPEMKGSIEVLWDTFGGEVNELGYKILNDKIGLIYGESINYEKAKIIFEKLSKKGFASTNVVMGVGSYLVGYVSRDTFANAIKSTYQEINGVGKNIFKDPITDDGTKKSAKGLLVVKSVDGKPTLFQEQTWDDVNSDENLLKIRYADGELFNQTTFEEVRERTKLVNIFE